LRSARRGLSPKVLEAAEPGAQVVQAPERALVVQALALVVRAREPVPQVAELRAEQAPPVVVALLEQAVLVPAAALPT
jgi:hypothetical protein